jgi:NADH dehydrogenase FAD-containing subunit
MAISLAFIRIIIVTMMDYIPMLINQNLSALRHRLTYKLLPSTLNVLVIGGSYTGIHLAKRLAESLPTGYKVVLVERKSHFNHLFNFPRYSVVKGREERAFIPYDGVGKSMAIPQGILEHVTGTVTKIKDTEVELANGDTIPFSYLAICTGATLPPPATLTSLGKKESCAELQNMQNEVEGAKKIAIVGGGAVGVQIAGDIKSFYPQKDVTLVHSRPRLLNAFGETLGEFVVGKLEAMGVRVVLGERPQWLKGGKELTFKDGQTESFDLVVRPPPPSLFSPKNVCISSNF